MKSLGMGSQSAYLPKTKKPDRLSNRFFKVPQAGIEPALALL